MDVETGCWHLTRTRLFEASILELMPSGEKHTIEAQHSVLADEDMARSGVEENIVMAADPLAQMKAIARPVHHTAVNVQKAQATQIVDKTGLQALRACLDALQRTSGAPT